MGRRFEREGVKQVNMEIVKTFGNLTCKQISDIRHRKAAEEITMESEDSNIEEGESDIGDDESVTENSHTSSSTREEDDVCARGVETKRNNGTSDEENANQSVQEL